MSDSGCAPRITANGNRPIVSRRALLRRGLGTLGGCVGAAGSLGCLGVGAADPPENRPVPRHRPRLGINLSSLCDWNSELPFVDAFRMSRPWVSQRDGERFGHGPPLDLDRHGWVRRLEPGCWAETLIFTDIGGHYPSGVYTVLYDGEGILEFGSNSRVVERQPGLVRLEQNPARGGLSIRLRRTEPANPVRNIRAVMPGFENTWRSDPFHPAFLRRWKGMACLRFMDWMGTNGSQVRRWSDRSTTDDATFSGRGVPLETMIALCNRLGIDPWFCMPHLADDDYVAEFAALTRAQLDPARTVYLEYSNEVWNHIFAQARWAGAQGIERNLGPRARPWEGAWHFTALRSMEIFAIWERVFGGHDRLVRVLPAQAGNLGVIDGVCAYRDAYRHADALAIAPYMSFNIGVGALKDVAGIDSMSVSDLLDLFEAQSVREATRTIDLTRERAARYGLKMLAYEAGQHMLAMTSDRTRNDRLSRLLMEANRSPRMGTIYTRHFDTWAAAGGDLMNVFASVARWSVHGCWGLAEYADQRPADVPKYAATLRWARAAGQPVAAETDVN